MNDDKELFEPTVEWMALKYDELNRLYFGGELGACDFYIFTSTKELGHYRMTGKNLKAERYNNGAIYQLNEFGKKTYVDYNNFPDICKPLIGLTGRYSSKGEYPFLKVLAHEMCHYYTYMHGYAPETGHGYEFKEITRLVGIRSNGFFDIHRLADEDDMSGFVMKEKYVKMVEKRKSNKKKGLTAVLSYYNDGEILLTTTSSQSLIEKLCANVNMDYYGRKKLVKVVVCNDSRLISVLFDNNYTVDFRTCKGWPVKGSEWLKLLDYMDKAVYKNKNYVDTNESTRRGNINKIITEVVNDFINKKKDNGVVSLSPDVNYSEVSPFGK